MKSVIRLLLISAFVATLILFVPTRPASADTCIVGSGVLANGASITITAPAGHTYLWVYTGAASGTITVTGTITIVNGTGGTLNYTTYDTNCAPPTFFNPGDGRVDPRPADRVVVYCKPGANPPSVDVWGVLNDSTGRRLYTFAYADLVAAGAKGITKNVEPLGTISLRVDANNNVLASWTGGPAAATGVKDFAKSFTCSFAQ
jgi:hypothetical protein